MNDWKVSFLKCLELGTVDPSLANAYEEIVDWMRKTKSHDDGYLELIDKYGESGLNLRFEEFLDRLLIADNASAEMFPISLQVEDAKKRYRQLIRIFHPDRGAHDEDWLNYRAERINSSYKEYENRPQLQTAEVVMPTAKKQADNNGTIYKNQSNKINTKIKYKPNAMRAKLGNAATLQKKIIFALCSFSVFLVLLVFLSSKSTAPDNSVPNLNVTGTQVTQQQALADNTFDVESDEVSQELISEEISQELLKDAEWLTEEDTSYPVDDVEEPSLNLDGSLSQRDTPELSLNNGLQGTDINSLSAVGSSQDSDNELSSKLSEPAIDNVVAKSLEDKISCDGSSSYGVDSVSSLSLVPNTNALNVRAGPSIDCLITFVIDRNDKLQKLKTFNDDGLNWAYVFWQDESKGAVTGWVNENFLTSFVESNSPRNEQNNFFVQSEVAVVRPELVPVRPAEPATIVTPSPTPVIETSRATSVPQAPPSSVSQPASGVSNINQAHVVLSKLEDAFQEGSALNLISLYTSTGRENNVVGVDQIQVFYTDLFAKTSNRSVAYNVESYEFKNPSQITVSGQMTAEMRQRNSAKSNISSASFSIEMINEGSGFKIVSFYWW